VLGQAHTLRRRRLIPPAVVALVTLAALLVLPALGGANPSQSAASLRALDAQLEAKQRAAVLGLYALDQQLAGAQSHLAALHAQAASLAAQRRELGRELTVARRGSRIAQRQLGDQLRALYEQRRPSSIEILLGARSLDQALSEIDNLSTTSAQTNAIIAQVESSRRALTTVSRGLAARTAALDAATRRAAATASALDATRTQRSSYIRSLADKRALNEQQVARLVAQARAAAARSALIERTARQVGSAPAAEPIADVSSPLAGEAPPTGGVEMTVSATGYALSGHTATGLPVGWGIAAVDPSVIPLGTHFYVPGYGEAVAADTGGAIYGSTVDLWFPTETLADVWGRRTVTIVLH
jgi:3D (Asp-Asp-Asp) domain-containing protein